VKMSDLLGLGDSSYKVSATFDVSKDVRTKHYTKPCAIGFCTLSQPYTTWSNWIIKSPKQYIFDTQYGKVYEVNSAGTGWQQRPEFTAVTQFLEYFPLGGLVLNRATGKAFHIGTDYRVRWFSERPPGIGN